MANKLEEQIEMLEARINVIEYAGTASFEYHLLPDLVAQLEELQSKPRKKEKEKITVSYNELREKEIISTAEVLELLQIEPSTLQRWVKAGIIKKHGIQSRVYFKFSEVIAAIQEI